jgi:signal transduction histidine kinase
MRQHGGLLVGSVARLPARVQTKLLIAFLAIVALLIALGAVGLFVLSGVNRRTEELIASERKIAAYRQVQHDTTSQLYSISSALLVSDERTLDSALRQLNQFGYDLERLQFVAKDEIKLLGKVRREYDRFITVVTRVVELIRSGRGAEAREAQLKEARPLASRLERLTNELVNRAEADVVADIEASGAAYRTSQTIVIGFALGAIALALVLGRAISLSLIGPIREIDARLGEIASGDFTRRVSVANRDELGALAVNINRASEELGRLYRELETASRHKSDFLANMSHELRTPLNAVLGYAELLADGIYGELAERPKGVVERIQNNGKHLLALINDVLDLAKIEAGQLTLNLEDYSLPDVVRGVVAATEPLAAAKGLKFSATVADGMPTARGDARRVSQVLLNLVGNAVKFTEAGEVEIRASAEGGRFLLSVRDTGPGIAEADQQRIFDEFQQIDNSNTRKQGGTGLGLAISKRMVEMQGGTIAVDSAPGHGSTFRVVLPVEVVPALEEAAE